MIDINNTNKTVYVIKDINKNFNFKVYQANIIGIYKIYKHGENSDCGYMLQLEDNKEIENYADFEVYEKLSDAQKEAERLNKTSLLFRLAFY